MSSILRSAFTLFLPSILAASALVSCGQPSASQLSNVSDISAYVSEEDAQRAFAIVRDIDYLPFGYMYDGCYARALYMSMELAAEGIPSSSHFAHGYFMPRDGVTWGYHVAPLLLVGEDAIQTILDPALEKEPITKERWYELLRPSYYTPTYATVPGNYYNPYTPAGTSMPIIRSFAELPPFQAADIQNACAWMTSYISQEGTADPAAKLARLKQRTAELATALARRGKLANYQQSMTFCQ